MPRFQNGAKLRDLMQTCGLAFALRQLDGRALHGDQLPVLIALSHLNPSTIAQAIPRVPADQEQWLYSLRGWHNAMLRFNTPQLHLDWASRRFNPLHCEKVIADPGALAHASNVADFVGANPTQFNPSWTLRRALDAMNDWHERMAHANHDEKFFLQNGLQWEEIIDYGLLPVERVVHPYAFRALQSGKALYEDGKEMHHCVGSYSQDVISGRSRIYSMVHVETLKRVATLELYNNQVNSHGLVTEQWPLHPWVLRQIKGPCNAAVSNSCHRTAAEFLAIVNRLTGCKTETEIMAEVKMGLIVQQAAMPRAAMPLDRFVTWTHDAGPAGPVA